MTRTTLLALAIVALAPAAASAQQAFTSGLVVLHDGDEVSNGAKAFGSVSDCLDNVEWRFQTEYFQRISVVEAWLGVGTIDCSTTANRLRSTNTTTESACKFLGRQNGVAKADIAVSSRDLFTGQGESPSSASTSTADDAGVDDAGVDDAGDTATTTGGDPLFNGCYRTRGTPTKTLFLLALDQETNTASNIAVAPQSIQKGVLKAVFTPYTDRPDAPKDTKPISGQSQIGISYEVDTANQAAQTAYRAYFDYGEGGSIGCGSGALEADDAGITMLPAPGTPKVTKSGKKTGSSVKLGDLDALGIAIGSEVAVSAVTVDPAQNESLPSEPICVKRVQTSSFYDSCKDDPKCKDGLSTCSLHPVPARALFAGLSLTGLALALVLRRRRKA